MDCANADLLISSCGIISASWYFFYNLFGGIHKHFSIFNVQKYINANMGTSTSIEAIWNHLSEIYDLNQLDDMVFFKAFNLMLG